MSICRECDSFSACRPDLHQWIEKKQVGAALHLSASALYNRAKRVGYSSPHRNAMPRRDVPRLCKRAFYYQLSAALASGRIGRGKSRRGLKNS